MKPHCVKCGQISYEDIKCETIFVPGDVTPGTANTGSYRVKYSCRSCGSDVNYELPST